MGFQQGLSGLNAASKNLEVIGNNVSNASTVGFKQSQAIFSDVYANSLNGSGASQVGIGTKIAKVQQQFTQGNITSTNNSLDIAINGGGFFPLSQNGSITYSRNGQFQLDKNGYIVNSDNKKLQGYNGVVTGGATTDIKIDPSDLPPKTTTKVVELLSLDSRSTTKPTASFDATDPTTFNNSTTASVYDSKGVSHSLQSYFVKTAPGTWDVYATIDGVTPATLATTLGFSGTGVAPTGGVSSIPITVTTGATSPFNVTLDLSGSTEFGTNFSVNSVTQDGFTAGRLSKFNMSAEGVIVGSYTNGQSATLGQVVLANFTNPNGLQALGNNAWAESSTSGQPQVNTPNSGSLGVLQSNAVEDSNVDLTSELVNMITAQRVYQANAQTIKTQDQVLQTLVNLR
ncbi:MAG: flagellar hook protein FlgE [Methylophilaceae bacterium]|nr:flagellar hook protein FlgE [Methylophilaceae bacterium]